MMHVLADGPHLVQGGLDAEVGAGQHGAQIAGQRSAQINTGYHPSSLRRTPDPPRTVSPPETHRGDHGRAAWVSFPVSTVTALPRRMTRSPRSSVRTVPPRSEAW